MRSWSRLSVAVWTPLCALIALALPGAASALKAPPPQLRELEEADRKALETIAGHSEPLRDAVLKASLHVDALVETQRIQEQSSASFQERIGKLDKKQQEQVWEVVREPGLLDELATEERPSRSQLDAIAERHPKELAPAINAVGDKHHDLLVDVAQIHDRANVRFDAAIADLDAETQQAFRALVDQPDLLSVLVRRVNLVVRLGDSYRKNPKDTRSYLSALAVDVEKRNAAAEREWKERIEKDPKAAEELDQAARDYAEENGYDYDELTSPEARTRVTVVVNPYPYWFGYPYWYSDFYLYPYGYWYPYAPYFGYYPYHHSYVWWGLPPWPFVHWFYWGHHHHHFAHFHNCFHGFIADHRFAPTHRFAAANNFIARSDQVDGHRGDWSSGRGGRGDGSTTGRAAVASNSGRDRSSFFNRNRAQGLQQVDRRSAPGERGFAIDDARGRSGRSAGRGKQGQIQPQGPANQREAGLVPGDARSLGGRGRGNERAARSNPSQFLQRPDSPLHQVEPRGRGRRDGLSRIENGVEVIRGAGSPTDTGGRGRGGTAPSVDSGGGGDRGSRGGGDGGGAHGRSWAGGGGDGGSRGDSSSGGGDVGGSRGNSSSRGGDVGGSRGHGWSGGGGDVGGSRGHSSSGGGDVGGSRGHGWSGGSGDGGGGSRGHSWGGGGRSGGGGRGGMGGGYGGGGGRGGGGFGGGGSGGGGGGGGGGRGR